MTIQPFPASFYLCRSFYHSTISLPCAQLFFLLFFLTASNSFHEVHNPMPNGLNIFVFHNCAKLFKVFFSGSRRGGRSIQLHETCWLIKENLEIKFPTICKEEKQTWAQLQKEKRRLVKSKRNEERKKKYFVSTAATVFEATWQHKARQ